MTIDPGAADGARIDAGGADRAVRGRERVESRVARVVVGQYLGGGLGGGRIEVEDQVDLRAQLLGQVDR